MTLVANRSMVNERSTFSIFQLGFSYEQMNGYATFLVLNDIPPFFTSR